MTAFIPYVTFMKHAQKVVKSPTIKTRPILGGVIHRDNYVAVTDSHRLYKADNLHEGDEKQVDPITGLEVDNGNYPEVERLIQDSANAKHTYTIDVTHAYEAVRAIEIASKINKATDDMNIVTDFDYIEFTTSEKAPVDASYSAGKSGNRNIPETTLVSIKYLKEALHVLKDAKVDQFTLEFFGTERPIQIRAGNFTAIVLPIRKI